MSNYTDKGRILRCIQTLNHDGKVIPLDAEYEVTEVEQIYDDKNDHVIVDQIITLEHTEPSGLSDKICKKPEIHFDKLTDFFTNTQKWN